MAADFPLAAGTPRPAASSCVHGRQKSPTTHVGNGAPAARRWRPEERQRAAEVVHPEPRADLADVVASVSQARRGEVQRELHDPDVDDASSTVRASDCVRRHQQVYSDEIPDPC
jgi:hypothetical protein